MTETTFTAAQDREVRVSADATRVLHRAGAWSSTYPVEALPGWIAFYERMAGEYGQPTYKADLEVLRAAHEHLAAS